MSIFADARQKSVTIAMFFKRWRKGWTDHAHALENLVNIGQVYSEIIDV